MGWFGIWGIVMADGTAFLQFEGTRESDGSVLVVRGISGSYTVTDGIDPGLIFMNIAASDTELVPEDGSVTFDDGQNTPLVISNCRLTQVVPTSDTSSHDAQVQIRDGRWVWNKHDGLIIERNVRDDKGNLWPMTSDGTDVTGRTMPLNQLVRALASAMSIDGTTKILNLRAPFPKPKDDGTYGDGTTFARPYIEAIGEYPGEHMMNILGEYGLRITLDYDGTIDVWPIGVTDGTQQDTDYLSKVVTKRVIDPPKSIYVVTSNNVDGTFALTPVILDTDGTLYEDNDVDGSSVSYFDKDKGGFNESTGNRLKMEAEKLLVPGASAQNLADGTTKLKAAKAFSDSWCRWYRLPESIKLLTGGDDSNEEDGTRADYIRRWNPFLKESIKVDGMEMKRRPYVIGPHRVADSEFMVKNSNNTGAQHRVEASFQIDKQLGLVKFGMPVVQFSSSGKMQTARSLKIRANIGVSPSNYSRVYTYTWKNRQGLAKGKTNVVDIVKRLDLDRADGTAEWNKKCLSAARERERQFWDGSDGTTGNPVVYVYPGIKRQWKPDGKISQVKFSMGANEIPQTLVAWGIETDLSTLSQHARLNILRDRTAYQTRKARMKTGYHTPPEARIFDGEA
jgi:hypothetical protein